jgi:hypothetical protein
MNRFRPLTFLPASEPRLSRPTGVSALHGVGVDGPVRRLRLTALLHPRPDSQGVQELLSDAGFLPTE